MKAVTRLILTATVAGALAGSPIAASGQRPSTTATAALDLQVRLDRAHFSPGEIDGTDGSNTQKALAAYRQSGGNPETASTSETLTTYTITPEDVAGPFIDRIPRDLEQQAKLPALRYTSALEALGEQFHASPNLIRRLNPQATFEAGEQIQVPNVEAWRFEPARERGESSRRGAPPTAGGVSASKIVVSKSNSSLTAYDASGKILMFAPVTSGSDHDPLPIGNWQVTAVVRNPTFNYNPELFWDADPNHAKAKIPPGPNGPVGVVWIDLSKEHYGIHGTPEPRLIGKTTSHGCVRLTNWDATALARLVQKGTPVIFEQ